MKMEHDSFSSSLPYLKQLNHYKYWPPCNRRKPLSNRQIHGHQNSYYAASCHGKSMYIYLMIFMKFLAVTFKVLLMEQPVMLDDY